MSLQVWLPLNGSIVNQGLNNGTITWPTAATYTENGKIGKALATGAATMSAEMTSQILNNKAISIALWLYVNADADDSTNRTMIFGNDSMSALGGRQFSIFRYPYSDDIHLSWQNCINGTYTTVVGGVWSGVLTPRAWNHICVTYDNPTAKIYVNGTQVGTATGIMNTDSFYFDTKLIYNSTSHYINDFRIYDHCLSKKEIKELAKGLVLHYKLDDPYIESTTNLVTTDQGLTDTCYNGATSKYGYGANTDMYKVVGEFQSRHCTKVYMGTDGLDAYPYVYFPIQTAVNETKTLSFDYFPTLQNTVRFYNLTTTTDLKYNINGVTGTSTNTVTLPVNLNQWNHIELTTTNTGTASGGMGYMQIGGAKHVSNTSNYWLFANIQVELKDHATGYVGVGGTRTSGIIFDNSGYKNNGLPIDVPIISPDTSRYSRSTFFDGTDDGILIENLQLSNIINSEITYSFWIKPNGETGARSVYFGSYSGTSWSIEKTTNNLLRLYWNGSPDETTTGVTIADNIWQHICITKKGTNDIKVYINGEQKWTSTAAHNILTFPTTYRIGRDVRSGDNTPYKGLMSDFRIYATALSAEDIKELYKTPASIDNKGNIYAYEFEEV